MSPDGLPSFAAHRGPRTLFYFCEQPVRNTAAPSPYLSLSYLHSEECRVEEELLTAVRDYRPDLLEQAQNDRTLRRLETPIVRLAKSLRIAGDDEGTESIVRSKKRRPAPRLLMLSTSRIKQDLRVTFGGDFVARGARDNRVCPKRTVLKRYT